MQHLVASIAKAGHRDYAARVLAAGGVYARLLWAFNNTPELRAASSKVGIYGDVLHTVAAALGIPFSYDKIDTDLDITQWMRDHETELSVTPQWAKYIPWLTRETARWWNSTAVYGEDDYFGFLSSNWNDVWAILRRGGQDVSKLRLPDVVDEAREIVRKRDLVKPPVQGTVVYRYASGWTVQKLSDEQVEDESTHMEHCVKNYADKIRSGECTIYSIRDADGFPHVTIERNDNGNVVQIQGKGNQFPARYTAAIREAIINVMDDDMLGRILIGDAERIKRLSGDIRHAEIRSKNLADIDFRGSEFHNIVLSFGAVARANFSGCTFSNVFFTVIDARAADFSGAELTNCVFARTDLRGADFSNATLETQHPNQQFVNCQYDDTTVWPDGFTPPKKN